MGYDMAVLLTLVFLAFVALPMIAAQEIGEPKDRQGWIWGLCLSWLGVIIVACLGMKVDPDFARLEREVRRAELERHKAELYSVE